MISWTYLWQILNKQRLPMSVAAFVVMNDMGLRRHTALQAYFVFLV